MTKKFNKEVPIFFAIDDNYLPYFTVAINSIKKHANKNTTYSVFVLTEGLSNNALSKILALGSDNFKFNIVDLSQKIAKYKKVMQQTLRDYYTVSIFYRLFIAEEFKQYDKAIYIDSDIVLLDDIQKLFAIDLGNNLLGVVVDQVVSCNEVFIDYCKNALGVNPEEYFNSGVLVMNLKRLREERLEEKFLSMIKTHKFETVAPDQDYLNVLCNGKVKYLPAGWDRMPTANITCDKVFLVHYNMFDKPWKYKGVMFEEHFWENAKTTEYYHWLLNMREDYSDSDKEKDLNGAKKLAENALRIIAEKNNFKKILRR